MRCEISGLNDIISDLEKLADDTENIADEMLDAAAEVMKTSWRDEIERRGLVDTGSMRNNVQSTISRKNRTVDTYPQKKDKKGTSNATKAFVLHHGRDSSTGDGAIKATYFVNDVLEDGSIKAQGVMHDVLDKHLKEKGL